MVRVFTVKTYPTPVTSLSMDVRAVYGLPSLDESKDLAILLNEVISYPDLLCVASTAVSKSEGRVRLLSGYDPSPRANELAESLEADPRFVEAVLQESIELLIEDPFLLSVTEFGHVSPNAGVDKSNVEGSDNVLLLPDDPMRSAEILEDALELPVVVTDTCGRPFRCGQTGVAIGWSGVSALRDWRGENDLYGRELEATEEAVVDELAATANFLMGEGAGGAPAVTFRFDDDELWDGSDSLYRDREDDIVRKALLEYKES